MIFAQSRGGAKIQSKKLGVFARDRQNINETKKRVIIS